MARSRRKFKKNKPKVRIRVPKKFKIKPPEPIAIPGSEEILELNDKTVVAGYKKSGILYDANALRPAEVPLTEEVMVELEPDDVRSALGKQRKDGKKVPLQRLTTMQKYYVTRLIQKHGDDFEAMAKDIKLNRMQQSVGALKKLYARFQAYDKLPETPEGN